MNKSSSPPHQGSQRSMETKRSKNSRAQRLVSRGVQFPGSSYMDAPDLGRRPSRETELNNNPYLLQDQRRIPRDHSQNLTERNNPSIKDFGRSSNPRNRGNDKSHEFRKIRHQQAEQVLPEDKIQELEIRENQVAMKKTKTAQMVSRIGLLMFKIRLNLMNTRAKRPRELPLDPIMRSGLQRTTNVIELEPLEYKLEKLELIADYEQLLANQESPVFRSSPQRKFNIANGVKDNLMSARNRSISQFRHRTPVRRIAPEDIVRHSASPYSGKGAGPK